MNYPWGISGPVFLELYLVGLAVALAFAVVVRARVRRPPEPSPGQWVTVLDLAFLSGGPQRVVESAIARLVDTGMVRTSRGGMLTAVDGASTGDPVELAVLREIGAKPRSVATVVRKAARSKAVTRTGDGLVEQRLLVAPAAAREAQYRAVIGLFLLLAVGVARVVVGVRGGYPVTFLVMLLAGTAVLLFVLVKRRIQARTVYGDRVLAAARSGPSDVPNAWLSPAAATGLAGAAGAVALGGLLVYPELAVRDALVATGGGALSGTTGAGAWAYQSGSSCSGCSAAPSSWSGSDSSGSSCGSSSGSSCGGGGGCGGGCGSG